MLVERPHRAKRAPSLAQKRAQFVPSQSCVHWNAICLLLCCSSAICSRLASHGEYRTGWAQCVLCEKVENIHGSTRGSVKLNELNTMVISFARTRTMTYRFIVWIENLFASLLLHDGKHFLRVRLFIHRHTSARAEHTRRVCITRPYDHTNNIAGACISLCWIYYGVRWCAPLTQRRRIACVRGLSPTCALPHVFFQLLLRCMYRYVSIPHV